MTGNKPHIAFVHKDFPFSGAEQVTIDVANYLCRHHYEVSVLTYRHRIESYKTEEKPLFRVFALPSKRIKYAPANALFLRNFIREQGVDILIAYKELLFMPWLKAKTHVKYIYELHNMPGFDTYDIQNKMEQNAWIRFFYTLGIQWLLRRFYDAKYRRIYRTADAYGVLCDSYRSELIHQLNLHPLHNKLWVLPNSIPPVNDVHWHKSKTLLYVGRLSKRDKRVDRLLRIWHNIQDDLPDWTLKLVGRGREETHLKALADRLHLKNISFEGYTSHVKRYYDEATISCLTSPFEGWPLTIAEAQANGVIPIAFDSFSGIHEMISNDQEGLCIPAFDEKAYGQSIVSLLHDAPRLAAMQQAVVAKAKTYTIERAGAAWEAMLTSIL